MDFNPGHKVSMLYTNYRGETKVYNIIPSRRHPIVSPNEVMWWGKTKFHPEEQWMFTAFDVDRDCMRDFAISGICAWGKNALMHALYARIEDRSLDAIVEVVGEGPDFATYNRGKSAMRDWFLRELRHAWGIAEPDNDRPGGMPVGGQSLG